MLDALFASGHHLIWIYINLHYLPNLIVKLGFRISVSYVSCKPKDIIL